METEILTPEEKTAKKKKGRKNKSAINAEKASIRMLHYTLDGEDLTQEVDEEDIPAMTMEIFTENESVEEIYLMKPAIMYKRPIIEEVEL